MEVDSYLMHLIFSYIPTKVQSRPPNHLNIKETLSCRSWLYFKRSSKVGLVSGVYQYLLGWSRLFMVKWAIHKILYGINSPLNNF